MTPIASTTRPDKPLPQPSTRQPQHIRTSTAQPSSDQRPTQKTNDTAHPRITIRWAAFGGRARPTLLILNPPRDRPFVDLGWWV